MITFFRSRKSFLENSNNVEQAAQILGIQSNFTEEEEERNQACSSAIYRF